MKNTEMAIIQLLILVSLSCFSIVQNYDPVPLIEETTKYCKVIEITKTSEKVHGSSNAFIIIVQDTISMQYYTIVSLKTIDRAPCKIKKGNFYRFSLKKYYQHDFIISLGLKLSICIDGEIVHIPMSYYTTNIYTSSNLRGIYYYSP